MILNWNTTILQSYGIPFIKVWTAAGTIAPVGGGATDVEVFVGTIHGTRIIGDPHVGGF